MSWIIHYHQSNVKIASTSSTRLAYLNGLKHLVRVLAHYVARAAFKPLERVENILHIYSSRDSKVPISNEDWHIIEQFTLEHLLTQDSISVDDLLVARSGYDTTHKCGFIAAESIASAEWHKRIISSFAKDGKKFRAWAKGEHPTLFQIRIFLPAKYNIIPSIESSNILKKFNPFLNSGTFELLGSSIQNSELDLEPSVLTRVSIYTF